MSSFVLLAIPAENLGVAAAEWAAVRIEAAFWLAGSLSAALPVPLTYSEAWAWVVRVREVAS